MVIHTSSVDSQHPPLAKMKTSTLIILSLCAVLAVAHGHYLEDVLGVKINKPAAGERYVLLGGIPEDKALHTEKIFHYDVGRDSYEEIPPPADKKKKGKKKKNAVLAPPVPIAPQPKPAAISKVGSVDPTSSRDINAWMTQNPKITGTNVGGVDFTHLNRDERAGEDQCITIWASPTGELLKAGTGTACHSTVRNEVTRGVGNIIVTQGYREVQVALLPFKSLRKENTGAEEVNRIEGKLYDIESLEWGIRSMYVAANELIESDRNWRFLFHVNRMCHGGIDFTKLVQNFNSKCTAARGDDGVHTLTCEAGRFNACNEQFTAVKEKFIKDAGLTEEKFNQYYKVAIAKAD